MVRKLKSRLSLGCAAAQSRLAARLQGMGARGCKTTMVHAASSGDLHDLELVSPTSAEGGPYSKMGECNGRSNGPRGAMAFRPRLFRRAKDSIANQVEFWIPWLESFGGVFPLLTSAVLNA